MKNIHYYTVLSLFFIPLFLSAQNQRYYVNIQAGGQANGQSWTDAFPNLHDALVLALPGDEVWVAEGTYRPDATDRTAHYQLPGGVRLYGGFAGTELLLDERQPADHPTVLSGDIGTAGDSLDNSYNLLYLPYPDENTLVDGFTFRDGVANDAGVNVGEPGASGAAIYMLGRDSIAYATIRHCVFEHNTALTHGGAVYIDGSGTGSVAPLFEDCQFRYNRALLNGGALYRDGASWWERPADFKGCTFEYNRGDRGGCIYIADAERTDTTQIIASHFYHNYAVKQADVLALGRARTTGWSVLRIDSCIMGDNLHRGLVQTDVLFFQGNMRLQIDSSIFYNNKFMGGQGILSMSLLGLVNLYIDDCFMNASSTIYVETYTGVLPQDTLSNINNSVFLNGVLLSSMGKMVVNSSKFYHLGSNINSRYYDINNSTFSKNYLKIKIPIQARIQNCTFFKNIITQDVFDGNDTLSVCSISNCIFQTRDYDPTNSLDMYDALQFPFVALDVQANNCLTSDTLFYAGVQTGYVQITGPTIQIGPDPLFVDTLNNDLHLRPCSPAWNAGDNAGAQGLAADLDGRPRIADGMVDIGAYEIQPLANHGPLSVQAACFGQPEGAVLWDLENGCLPITYLWTHAGGTGSSTTGLEPGAYAYTITDARGRTLVQNVSVPTSSPQLALGGDTLICPAAHDGDLLALVGGAVEPVGYLWSTGSTAGSISGLGLGSYSLTVTDALGCQDVDTATIASVSVPLGLSILNTPASSPTTADGSLVVTVQSGQPPYTYAWAEVAGTGPGIAGLLPGVYHLSITDGSGCVTAFQFEVDATSGTTAVEALVPGSVQPNPVRGRALVRFGDATVWRLFSAAGVEMLRVETPAPGRELGVDLGGWRAGLYFYTFGDGARVLGQGRLIILGEE